MAPREPQRLPQPVPPPEEQPQEAQDIGPMVEEAVVAALTAALAASGVAATLAAVGFTAAFLARALVALLRPLAVVRIVLLGRRIEQQWNDAYFNSGPRPDIWRKIMLEEMTYEIRFATRSARRMARSMIRARERGDDLDEAFEKAMAREARFERMRQQAVGRRVTLRLEEEWVRDQSPEGAYWIMDPGKRTHTPDCIAMANKAWTWAVLAIIRPSNRHNLCGCRLVPLNMARANRLAASEVVHDVVPRVASIPHR